jgi:hypothetical protein
MTAAALGEELDHAFHHPRFAVLLLVATIAAPAERIDG